MSKIGELLVGLTTVLLVLASIGCSRGGGGGTDSSNDSSSGGWITITDPSDTGTASTYCNTETISGEAFISPTYYRCCSGSASDTGVTVTWENLTTGANGSASQSVQICYLFGSPYLCNHSWSASVPLIVGSNVVRVTAVDPAGVNGSATITISKPALSYSATGTLSTSDGFGMGYFQSGLQVQLTGTANKISTPSSAGSIGQYNFTCLPNDSYTVTPISQSFNYNFSPELRDFVIADQDITDLNFTTPAYPVSGTITWSSSGAPASNTWIRIDDGTNSWQWYTQSDGSYSFVVPNGNYTLTPYDSLCPTCNTFTPTSRSVTVLGSSVSGEDFLKN